jgi:hypothetical protein
MKPNHQTPVESPGLVFVLALTGLLTGAAAPSPDSSPFLVGACTHFSQYKGELEANLSMMRQAGIGSLRDEATWGALERERGRLAMPEAYAKYVRAARTTGLEPLLILDYANAYYDDGDRPRSNEAIEAFARYAEFVVRHFGEAVQLYEVWNEWDIGIGLPQRHRRGGSPEDYVRLLRKVHPRIKAADPNIIVMAGACTSGGVKKGWLEDIVRLGALDFCDAISIHSYNYSAGFPERSPEACSAWMDEVQRMLAGYNDGVAVPFYVTEMGWPTHDGKSGTSPELSASYLARLFLLARTSPSFRGLWWYDFQDDGWKASYNEDNFGLVRADLTPKPAYHVLADVSGLVSRGSFVSRLPTADADLWILGFSYQNEDAWAIWSGDDQERQVLLRKPGARGAVNLQQLGHPTVTRPWGHRPWTDRRTAALEPDRLSLVAGPRPLLLTGDLAGVRIEAIRLQPGRHD